MTALDALAQEYLELSSEQVSERINQIKRALGEKLVILAHHYQRDDVLQHADYTGDSLRLSQLAAQEQRAEYIVFCGVKFMAETADILTSPSQRVILSHPDAGCPMADMADLAAVEETIKQLEGKYGKAVLPITYVNSSAEIKALCGRHGGLTCTSSNAKQVLAWAFEQDKLVLFLPDANLAINTALTLGISAEETHVWENVTDLPHTPPRLVVWDGFCRVHRRFTVADAERIRETLPEANIIVHPECIPPLVQRADYNGSTDFIIKTVSSSPSGSTWVIGTEANLVMRLAKQNPDKTILSLSEKNCLCRNMNLTEPAWLLRALETMDSGITQVSVKPEIALQAKLALQRMLEIS